MERSAEFLCDCCSWSSYHVQSYFVRQFQGSGRSGPGVVRVDDSPGESEAVLNKVARGEALYTYAWFSCREDEDFGKKNWDRYISAALAVAKAKRELADSNAKRWVYWFALTSLGADLVKLSSQSVPALRAMERLVEFVGVSEPGEGEALPTDPAAAPVFAWFDAKAEAL